MLGVTNIAITKHRVTGMHPRRLSPPSPVFRALGRIEQVGGGEERRGEYFPQQTQKAEVYVELLQ